jgi:hypothetical protein
MAPLQGRRRGMTLLLSEQSLLPVAKRAQDRIILRAPALCLSDSTKAHFRINQLRPTVRALARTVISSCTARSARPEQRATVVHETVQRRHGIRQVLAGLARNRFLDLL